MYDRILGLALVKITFLQWLILKTPCMCVLPPCQVVLSSSHLTLGSRKQQQTQTTWALTLPSLSQPKNRSLKGAGQARLPSPFFLLMFAGLSLRIVSPGTLSCISCNLWLSRYWNTHFPSAQPACKRRDSTSTETGWVWCNLSPLFLLCSHVWNPLSLVWIVSLFDCFEGSARSTGKFF